MARPDSKVYVEKPHKVRASQYHTGDPVPPEVDTCTLVWADGRLHVHTDAGPRELHETDWFLYSFWTDRLEELITDAQFQERFGGGPPEVEER
jgi:hypothetical protein